MSDVIITTTDGADVYVRRFDDRVFIDTNPSGYDGEVSMSKEDAQKLIDAIQTQITEMQE